MYSTSQSTDGGFKCGSESSIILGSYIIIASSYGYKKSLWKH